MWHNKSTNHLQIRQKLPVIYVYAFHRAWVDLSNNRVRSSMSTAETWGERFFILGEAPTRVCAWGLPETTLLKVNVSFWRQGKHRNESLHSQSDRLNGKPHTFHSMQFWTQLSCQSLRTELEVSQEAHRRSRVVT